MLCQSRLYTASETFVHPKKFGSGSIFCVFASVACILIGKDGEYEKMEKRMWKFRTQCAMTLTPSITASARGRLYSLPTLSPSLRWSFEHRIFSTSIPQLHNIYQTPLPSCSLQEWKFYSRPRAHWSQQPRETPWTEGYMNIYTL